MESLDVERVVALVDKWRQLLGIGEHWSIGVRIHETEEDCKKKYQDCWAWVKVREAYFEADVHINAWQFMDEDDRMLDLVVCHEVLHILLHKCEKLVRARLGDENRGLATMILENQVELLSRAFLKVQDGSDAVASSDRPNGVVALGDDK